MIRYIFPTNKNPTINQVLTALSQYVLSFSPPLSQNITINGAIGISYVNDVVQNIQVVFYETQNEVVYTDPSTGYKASAQPLATIPSYSNIENLLSQASLI